MWERARTFSERDKIIITSRRIMENHMVGSPQISAKDISSKWGKFSEAEAGAIKNVEALSALVKSYGREKVAADAEVKAVMLGRTF